MKIKKLLFFYVILLLIHNHLTAQTFTNVLHGDSIGNKFAYLLMADIGNDGIPEIVQVDYDSLNNYSQIDGVFKNIASYPEFRGESNGLAQTLDIGDINRDGFIDLVQSGGPNNRIFRILINQNPGFESKADHTGFSGTTFLGDLEGDGDLDILYSGAAGRTRIEGVHLNNDGNFNSGLSLPNRDTYFASWSNLDQDSQLEVIQSVSNSYTFGGNFTLEKAFPTLLVDKRHDIPSFIFNIDFADYDTDGDLDVLVKKSIRENRIYKNVDGNFVDSNISFPTSKNAIFADVNNDGYYDVIIYI